MDERERWYRVLDLEPGASLDEVRRAWRDLAKVWHPDRFQGDSRVQAKAEEKLKSINEAYRVISESFSKGTNPPPPSRPRPTDPEAPPRTPPRPAEAPPEPPQERRSTPGPSDGPFEAPTLNPFRLFRRCFTWKGRLTRSEFAIAYFGHAALAYVGVLAIIFAAGAMGVPEKTVETVVRLFALAWLPFGIAISIGAGVRRLHDLGRPGWQVALAFVPVVNLVMILTWLFKPSAPSAYQGDKASSVLLVLAGALVAIVFFGIVTAIAIPSLLRARVASNEAAAQADVRSVMAAEAAYVAASNGNGYAADITCLAAPSQPKCIPGYAATAPAFLDSTLAKTNQIKGGYGRLFTPGTNRLGTGVGSFCYAAWPVTLNRTGIRSFAGDASGVLSGTMGRVNCCAEDGTLVGCPGLETQHSPMTAEPQGQRPSLEVDSQGSYRAYEGVVENTTSNVRGRWKLTLRVSGRAVVAEVATAPPLYGSGTMTGTLEGSSCELSGVMREGFRLTIRGVLSDASFQGAYFVEGLSPRRQEGWFDTYAVDATEKADDQIADTRASVQPAGRPTNTPLSPTGGRAWPAWQKELSSLPPSERTLIESACRSSATGHGLGWYPQCIEGRLEARRGTPNSWPLLSPGQAPVRISGISLGKAVRADNTVAVAAELFGPEDTIYASIETVGTGHAKLRALWSFMRGERTAKVSETTIEFDSLGLAANEFHVSKPSGWPKGDYTVDVFLGDSVTPAATKKFQCQ